MRTAQLKSVTVLITAGLAVIAAGPAFGSNWADQLASASSAEAQAAALPSPPGGVSASCVSSTASKITVTWNAVSQASSYTVYDSTTSATTGFTATAPGVTGTSWTSGSLSSGNYWFEVTATIGTNWESGMSSASGETTVVKNSSCVQP